MKKFNSIMVKISVIAVIICVLALGAEWILSRNNNETIIPVYNETGSRFMHSYIHVAKQFNVDTCRLWTADEPLEVNGSYWTYSTDFGQWIHCYESYK